jgi:hypothetical protein
MVKGLSKKIIKEAILEMTESAQKLIKVSEIENKLK